MRFALITAILVGLTCGCATSGRGPGAAQPTAKPPAGMEWDVSKVWANVTPDDAGRWPAPAKAAEGTQEAKPEAKIEKVDTSGYRDTTADKKGTVTACGEGFSGEGPKNVFDDQQTKWCIEKKAIWVEYKYAGNVKKVVSAYSITTANDYPSRDPKKWRLLGSADGKKWDVVDERAGENFAARFQKRLFKVSKPGEYRRYKLDVSENHGDVSSQLSEIELLEKK